jgi:Fur family transcriptional regulator, zinc uptake regulator
MLKSRHVHDHACEHGHPPAGDALKVAEARCAEKRLKLTPIRREVLEHLAASPAPIGAYDLIEKMHRASGRRPAPISVYRVLDFLLEAGLAHRIESRNAYVACAHRHEASDLVVFMICDTCGCVTEASGQGRGIQAGDAGGRDVRPLQSLRRAGKGLNPRPRERPSGRLQRFHEGLDLLLQRAGMG